MIRFARKLFLIMVVYVMFLTCFPASGGHSVAKPLSRLVEADLEVIDNASERIKTYQRQLDAAKERFKKLNPDTESEEDFRELKKIVKKLKRKISSQHKDVHVESIVPRSWQDGGANLIGTNADSMFDMPNLTKNAAFELTLVFKEFEASYRELTMELKMCLLSFSIFPENAQIKKRVMLYWWIGEGFVPPLLERNNNAADNTERTEHFANEFFKKLVAKGYVEPMRKKFTAGENICKMHPFVRSMVIKLAKRANFFDFDDEGNIEGDKCSSLRACLTGKVLPKIESFEKLYALFNLNEAFLEFSPELFAKMKNVNVLYLGRWQTSAIHHIEIEDTKTLKMKNANVLDGLKHVKHLRFLSLQGISRIVQLPESISKLSNLTILDIRACHNLEVLPEGIGLLKNLTHLDMSECYLLDQMPKGLALLSKLEVLSGFVVGDSDRETSCNLEDLGKLTNLRKLSIHTGDNHFPSGKDLLALNEYKALKKLTIAWGRGSVQAKGGETDKQDNSGGNSLAREKREENKKKDHNEAEQGTEVSKRSVLTRFSTSKQSPGTTNVGGGEDSKNNSIRGKQSPRTPNKENREDGKNKDVSEPTTPSSKRSILKWAKSSISKAATETVAQPVLTLGLTKLDLQCFPEMIPPKWLKANKMKSLKQLYIRGGKFSDLGQFQDFDDEEAVHGGIEKVRWEVQELRLRYLTEIEMDWRELQDLFPNLRYLEKVKCPRLTLFPCDESGVWIKKE